MKTIVCNDKIDWMKVSKLVDKDNLEIIIPNFYIGIRRNRHFFEKLKYTLKYFKSSGVKNVLTFIYDANFNYIYQENCHKLRNLTFKSDICLFSHDGEYIDGVDLLDDRFNSKEDNVNFYLLCKSKVNKLNGNGFRIKPLEEDSESAKKYLQHKTTGRYFLDASSTKICGVSYEFKTDFNKKDNYGYGRGKTFKEAREIADLESVERYASQYYVYKHKEIYGKFEELYKLGAINPKNFLLESWSNISEESNLYWKEAQSLLTGKKVLVPEDLVYYGNDYYRLRYKRCISDSSNGVALGGTYSEAIIGALMELMERNCFLNTWFGKKEGIQITNFHDFLNDDLREKVLQAEQEGLKIRVFDISMDTGVYVIWCLIENNNPNAHMYSYSAAGANINLDSAIKSALLETLVGINVQENNRTQVPSVKSIVTSDDHIAFYGNRKNKNYLSFVDSFPKKEYRENSIDHSFSYQEDVVQFLINTIKAHYKDIYITNLTSKELANLGLFIVKAIVPGMLPMTFGEKSLRVNVGAVNEIRKSYGLPIIKSIRQQPHPFP